MNRTVLITAGAKRIGKTLVIGLANRGYNIVIHYFSSQKEAHEIQHEVHSLGRKCFLFSGNFNKNTHYSTLIGSIIKTSPDLNLIINNASVFEKSIFQKTDESGFDQFLNINFKAPFFLAKEFSLQCQKGHIISIIDTKVYHPPLEVFTYCLSKIALYNLTRMAAKSMMPNFRVNGICPGLILPPEGKNWRYLEGKSQKILLKKWGRKESVLSAVFYLIDNPFINGECINVDGGEHLS